MELDPEATEDVSHFLVDASRYGVLIRPVEAPFLRRVLRERAVSPPRSPGPLYAQLHGELEEALGPPDHASSLSPSGTLDGDGILFVGYDGTLYPGGFLPFRIGSFPADSLVEVYRTAPVLRQIRAREFHGPCGVCPHRPVCGGSRARAFAHSGDPLGTDPACLFGRELAAELS